MSVETSSTTRAVKRDGMAKIAAASFIGSAIEWYDFFLFGTAAALVFGKLFFPGADPLSGTLLAFATFGVGFFARPLGGIIAGHLGDRIGRKKTLVGTLLLMGAATAAVGILPSYAAVGAWAPILLVALRLCQGLGVGGEWGALPCSPLNTHRPPSAVSTAAGRRWASLPASFSHQAPSPWSRPCPRAISSAGAGAYPSSLAPSW